MEVIRKFIDADSLMSLMILPEAFRNRKLEIIVFPTNEQASVAEKKMRQSSSNPSSEPFLIRNFLWMSCEKKGLESMKLLIDTNIVLDVLLKREPFYPASMDVLNLAQRPDMQEYILASAVTDIYCA